MSIKLIVGLQNPGSQYEQTRHNAGAWFVQALASHHGGQFKSDSKLGGQVCVITIDGLNCYLLLPSSFMNHSGQATRAVAHFYKIQPEEILIAHDELDLPTGQTKLKTGGGHGGHNGLRNIINQLKTNEFHRLRLGIGHPGHKDLVHNYVLSKPSLSDKQAIHDAISRALCVIHYTLAGHMAKAMNQLHS